MEIVIVIGIILAGWSAGAVINLLADQMPIDEGSVRTPICVACHCTIPLISYFNLSKCPTCHTRKGKRIWFIVAIYPALFLLLYFYPHERLPLVMGMILTAYMGLVAVIDLEHRLVLGPLSIAGIVAGTGSGLFLHGWLPTLFGGVAGFAFMFAIYWLGRAFSAWMAKKTHQPVEKEAMGFGDVYIALVIGLVLGWPGITAGLILGIVLGGLFSGLYLLGMFMLRRYHLFSAIPYAPFLLGATMLLIFWPK